MKVLIAMRSYSADGFETPGTVEYDLWVNVISGWNCADHANINYSPRCMNQEGSYLDHKNAVGFYAEPFTSS